MVGLEISVGFTGGVKGAYDEEGGFGGGQGESVLYGLGDIRLCGVGNVLCQLR